jgi:hypothetical protein
MQRRQEKVRKLCAFAPLREVFFVNHDMHNYFDVTLEVTGALLFL